MTKKPPLTPEDIEKINEAQRRLDEMAAQLTQKFNIGLPPTMLSAMLGNVLAPFALKLAKDPEERSRLKAFQLRQAFTMGRAVLEQVSVDKKASTGDIADSMVEQARESDAAVFLGEGSHIVENQKPEVPPLAVRPTSNSIAVGPVEFDCDRARKVGWTEDEINTAWTAIAAVVRGHQQVVAKRRGHTAICPACEQWTSPNGCHLCASDLARGRKT